MSARCLSAQVLEEESATTRTVLYGNAGDNSTTGELSQETQRDGETALELQQTKLRSEFMFSPAHWGGLGLYMPLLLFGRNVSRRRGPAR